MEADISFIEKMIATLYRISGECPAGVTRHGYTKEYRRAVDYVSGIMLSEGMSVREDSVGNLFGSIDAENDKPGIFSGSHLDTVRCGGAYDGAAGLACAIEAARMVRRSKIPLKHPYTAFATIEEEGSTFGQVCLGSRFLTGENSEADLKKIVTADGRSLFQVLEDYRLYGNTERISERASFLTPAIPDDQVLAFLELHGEQGPILDEEQTDIGIVDHITGMEMVEVTITGQANHSGTVPMDRRRDAGIEAFRVILSLRDYVTEHHCGRATVTAGALSLEPGKANVIPGKCRFSLDIRSGRESVLQDILAYVERLQVRVRESGQTMEICSVNQVAPSAMDRRIRNLIRESCIRREYSFRTIDSGAGHDSMIFTRRWPTGMIFIPTVGGISHHPEEKISSSFLKKGAEVLYDTIRAVDASF